MNREIVIVKNAEGDPDTKARVLIKNKIDYIPKVSVIIPVYNTEKYLRECLDSVINQTLKEIEIICVDDGSTDNSLEILKEYAAKDNRITVLNQENLYAGVARNAGMMVASGEYYHFLDSDDWVEDNIYEKCVENNKNYDIVVFANNVIDENTQELIRVNKANIDDKDKIFTQTNPNAWSKLFNKCFIQSKKIKFEGLKIANDLTFTYTALALANNISCIDIPLISYRSNQKFNLTANRGDNIECFFKALQKLSNNLKANDVFYDYENIFYDRAKSSLRYELKFCRHSYSELKQVMSKVLDSRLYSIFVSELIPKVSIIISVYNAEKYLRECLDSVINQTLKDIEIICVNDGSTDNSLTILQEYEKIDDRIKIIDQKNQGLSISRNNAFAISTGQYIQYLDADDYIDLMACERIYLQAIQNDLDILMIGGNNFDNNGNITENTYYSFKYLPDDFKQVFNYIDCKSFITRIAVSSCLNIYKKSFLSNKKINWINKKLCYEDNLFFTEALFKANKIGICREKLYFRRIHEESITQNIEKNFNDKIEMTWRLFEILSQVTTREYIDKYLSSRLIGIINDYNKIEDKEKYYLGLKDLFTKIFIKFEVYYSHIMLSFIDFAKIAEFYLKNSRIDIKNIASKNNKLEVIQKVNNMKIISTEKSNGYSFIGDDGTIEFKTIKSGKLVIDLFNDNEVIEYNQIKLNGKNLLEKPLHILKGNSYKIKKHAFNNQKFKLEIDYSVNLKDKLSKYYSDKNLVQIIIKNFYELSNMITLLKSIKKHFKQTKFRLDLKNIGDKNNSFELLNLDDINIQKPSWFSSDKGQGVVIHGDYGNKSIKLKAIGSGDAYVKFMSSDIRLDGKRLPIFTDFANVSLNQKCIFSNISASHDKFIKYNFSVKSGDEFIINFDCCSHNYTDVELEDILSIYAPNKQKDLLVILKSNIDLDNLLKVTEQIKKDLNGFKINIRNVKTPENKIELLNNSSKINVSTPDWFTNDKGIGSVLISQNYKDRFKVKAIGNGNLSFKFMGIDKRFNNEKIPLYVNYQSIKINGKEILDEPITAWHDKAFVYEMKVKDSEIIDVEVIKSPYPYTKNELKDLIIKLSNGVEPKDINNIIKHIIKNRLEYEKSTKTKQPSKIFSITREKYKTIYYLLGLKYVKFNTRREILDLIKEENAKLKKEIEQLKIELKNK